MSNLTVRLKFRCDETTKQTGYGEHPFLYGYKLQAVTSGSEENREFWAATPSGQLNFQAARSELFKVGEEYYLDISLADQ